MILLSDQDPAAWNRALIDKGAVFLARAMQLDPDRPRVMQARIHGCWCQRGSLADPAPWHDVLALYDVLLGMHDTPVVRLNRAVALAEVGGVGAALEQMKELNEQQMREYAPYQAVRADLLRRAGDLLAARDAYDRAIALVSTTAERAWLLKQKSRLDQGGEGR